MPMFDRVQFLLSEAFIALRRNGLMTIAAVSTVAVSLFIAGGLGYAYLKLSAFADTLPSKFEVRVFLKDGTKTPQISETAQAIRKMPGVAEVVWMPKEAEWAKERAKNPDDTEGLENPLPDALRVRLSKLEGADSLVEAFKRMPTVIKKGGVTDDPYSRSAVLGILNVLRWLGGVLGGLLFLTGGILIHNAIRMTIIVRRREIRIMQLVGASQSIVCTPFLIEGVMQGLMGGCLATLLVWSADKVFLRYAEGNIKLSPEAAAFPLWTVFAVLCGAGALYGLCCSGIAAREPLKLR